MLSGFGSRAPAHGAFGFFFPNSNNLGLSVFLGFCVCGKDFLVISRYGDDLG